MLSLPIALRYRFHRRSAFHCGVAMHFDGGIGHRAAEPETAHLGTHTTGAVAGRNAKEAQRAWRHQALETAECKMP